MPTHAIDANIIGAALPGDAPRTHSDAYLRDEASRILGAFLLCLSVVAGLCLADARFVHWFVIPVTLCGALIGADALAFWQGRLAIFDPVAVIGLLGVHFFFVAPLLHLWLDAWMAYVDHPRDWREWLGRMAILNLIGLLVYRLSRGPERQARSASTVWRLDRRRWPLTIGAALILTAALQALVYVHFGGVSGYMDAYVDMEVNHGSQFAGWGWVFTISESFPILGTFAMVAWLRSRKRRPAWSWLVALLVINFAAQMVFGGLRGSRSNTIWGLFWTLGAIHLWLRPATRTVIVSFAAFMVAFMYLYGFYKAAGPEAAEALRGGESLDSMSHRSGRTLAGAILGDLGRSDVQAFALYRISTPTISYDYAWGRTYLGAVTLLIPAWVWPERPVTKVKWTTEVEYGPTWYDPGRWQSSRVYGAAGEAMLNFGPAAVPFAFLALGLIVRIVRTFAARLTEGDSRQLLLPLLVMFCFIFLVSDSDNDVFVLVKFGLIPLAVVLLSSNRHLLEREAAR